MEVVHVKKFVDVIAEKIKTVSAKDERNTIRLSTLNYYGKIKLDLRKKQRQTAASSVNKCLLDCEQTNAGKKTISNKEEKSFHRFKSFLVSQSLTETS